MKAVKKTLKQTNQCKTCPFIKGNDPFDIPDGYSVELHKALSETIADPNQINIGGSELHCMACHYSPTGDHRYCIGWLNNQLGVGNNIALRMQMMAYNNVHEIKTIGEQHKSFFDTLPKP